MSRATLLLATFVMGAWLFPSPVAAQPGANGPNNGEPVKRSLHGDGSEFFRALLHIRGVKPVKEKEALALRNFDDVIVIVLGNPNKLQGPRMPGVHGGGGFNQILSPQDALNNARRGGAIFIASSSEFKYPLIQHLARISGIRVEAHAAKSILDGLYHDCPFAVPIPRPSAVHDPQSDVRRLFNGDLENPKKLERVVAGTPSYILVTEPREKNGIAGLAGFPESAFEIINQKKVQEKEYFAVGGELEDEMHHPYRLLMMGSSRVFNNALLYRGLDQPDDRTDNLELCLRTIEYLQGPNQQRKKCIFFENGQLIEHFDDLARATTTQSMPMPGVNLDSLQKYVIDRGNRELDRIQANNLPNKWINDILGLPRIVWLLLWASGLSALFFLIQRIFGSRRPGDIPPAPTILPASSRPPGVFERRQKELLRRNNVYEPVRDLIRDFFLSLGVESEPGPKIPKLQISERVRKPDSLRIAIKDLWRLAFGSAQVVNVSFWRDLEPYFLRVCEAHDQGKWAFAFENKDVGESWPVSY